MTKTAMDKMLLQHEFYKTGDADAPGEIKDRNGEVVLQMCRLCGRAEIELVGLPCCDRRQAIGVRGVMTTCEHQYVSVGVRYCDGVNPLPGSGASRRYYAHVFFCSRCLTTRGTPIPDPGGGYDVLWSNYEKPRFNATPGTPDECGVPVEDRRR